MVFKSIQKAFLIREAASSFLYQELLTKPKNFQEFLIYKKLVSSQKFAPFFERNLRRILSLKKNSDSNYDAASAHKNYEFKYATVSSSGMVSFPQLIREGLRPEYIIIIFEGDDVLVSRIPSAKMHRSILRKHSTKAHFSNIKEKRISFSVISPEMDFIRSYRDRKLERKIINAKYE